MRNKTVIVTAIVCAVLFLSALGVYLHQRSAAGDDEIVITLDGETIYRGSATKAGSPFVRDVQGAYTNTIRIDAQGVKVESSDCPGCDCVRMGYLKSKSLPIVCLPNRLVIRYTDSADAGDVDAVSE